jgi:hypothetical protein
MEWPIAIVLGSVAMGAAVGLIAPGRGRLLDAIRTFAIVSSVAVVVGRLIPDAVTAGGPIVLIAVAVAFLAPWLIERAAHEDPEHDHSSTMGLELSYWGLMLDVLTAIAVHSVPVTALITLAFTSAHGVKSGIRRAIGLAAVGSFGVVLAQQTSLGAWTRGEAWIEAAVSGLLLHVVTHDWAHEHDSPALPGWPQVIAIAAGVGVLLLGR